MTLHGAIQQLHDMRCNEKFPIYYKPAIDEVIKTIEADAQEVRHGRWVTLDDEYIDECKCSSCGVLEYFNKGWKRFNYCPNCGAAMIEEEVA